MKKIHSQPRPSVIGPPTSHAAVPPMAPVEPQIPSALLRSAPSGNVVITIDSAVGVMTAAATPWTARAVSSAALVPASPAPSDASANRPVPSDEHPAAPEQVGGAPAQQEQTAEAEQVGAQHPLQIPGRERQVRVDRGQRDDDDRGIEDDHEERRAQQRKRLPAAGVQLCRGVCVLWVGHDFLLSMSPPESAASTRRRSRKGDLDRLRKSVSAARPGAARAPRARRRWR